jgi:ubiquitin-conjugating enzyme E2 M
LFIRSFVSRVLETKRLTRDSFGRARGVDISELALPKTMAIEFPNGRDDLMHFIISVKPDSGYYAHGVFRFTFAVPAMYPHEPPKVRCEQKVYHPNIDLDGNVCLNILREDWKPVLSISSILFGLSLLFAEPNPHDPLNKEAAEELVRTPRNFELNVRRAMQGGYVGSHKYSAVLR